MSRDLIPAKTPVRIRWVLPRNFNGRTAGKFIEEARKTICAIQVSWPDWLDSRGQITYIRPTKGLDYLCIDIAGLIFPGYFAGQPTLNDYTVTLSECAAQLVGKHLELLQQYGARIETWEVSNKDLTVSR